MENTERFRIKSIYELEKNYKKADSISCIPDKNFQQVEEGHIFDENQSVRWNKEEVIRINNEYKMEVERLQCKKAVECEKAVYDIKQYIMQKANFTEHQADIFWEYIYEKYNGYDLFDELNDMICLYNELQTVSQNNPINIFVS